MLGAAVAILNSPVGSKAVSQGIGLLIRGGWKKVADFCTEHYAAEPEIQKEIQDLGIKLSVIQQPLDILARQVANGNQAVEGARDVAIAILQEIEQITQDMTDCKIREARREPRPGDMETSVVWARKLKCLRQRLDGMMPYLNVAISTASMTPPAGSSVPRLGRLLWASGHLQKLRMKCSRDHPVEIFALEEASMLWLKRNWETRFLDAAVSLSVEWDASVPDHPFRYILSITEIFPDGQVDDDNDAGEESSPSRQQLIDLEDLTQMEWSTTQALLHCAADFSPALILRFTSSQDSASTCSLAIQCRFRHTAKTQSSRDAIAFVQDEWDVLGRLEYLVNLGRLEIHSHTCHTCLTDKVLVQAFGCPDPHSL